MSSAIYPYLSLLYSQFVFLFSPIPHSLLATRQILQFTMFDSISLQPVRNIKEVRNTSYSTTKEKV